MALRIMKIRAIIQVVMFLYTVYRHYSLLLYNNKYHILVLQLFFQFMIPGYKTLPLISSHVNNKVKYFSCYTLYIYIYIIIFTHILLF